MIHNYKITLFERLAPFFVVVLGISMLAVFLPALYTHIESAQAVAFTSTSTVVTGLNQNENARMLYVNNTYYVTYTSTTDSYPNLYITNSIDGGSTWGAPVLIDDALLSISTNTSYIGDFSLDYSTFADILVVTYKTDAATIYATSNDDGDTWVTSSLSGVFTNCDFNVNEVAIAFATSSNFTAALCGSATGLFELVTSSDSGQNWSAPTTVYDGSTTYSTSDEGALYVSGSAGNEQIRVIMIVSENGVGSEIIYAESTDAGSTFTTSSALTVPVHGGLFATSKGLSYGFDSNGLASFVGELLFNDIAFAPPNLAITTTLIYGKRLENGTWTTTTVGNPVAKSLNVMGGMQPTNNQLDILFYNDDNPIISGVGEDPALNPVVFINTSTFIETTVNSDNAFFSINQIEYNADDAELAHLYISTAGNLIFSTSTLEETSAFAGGDGSGGDPYQIADCSQLQTIDDNGTYLTNSYVLTADITCTDITPIARDMGISTTTFDATYAGFSGSLDGDGYTITYTVDPAVTEEGYVGLFGYLNGATISDLTIAGSVTGTHSVGGLAAFASSSSFTNIVSSVDVVANNVSSNIPITAVGGLIGYVDGSSTIVSNSTVSGDVTTVGNVIQRGIGGFVGVVIAGQLESTNGTMSGHILSIGDDVYAVGGVFGFVAFTSMMSDFDEFSGSITVSTTDGSIDDVAGFAGNISASTTITNATISGNITILSDGESEIDDVGGLVGILDEQNVLRSEDNTISNTIQMIAVDDSSTLVNNLGGLIARVYSSSTLLSTNDNILGGILRVSIYDGHIEDIGGIIGDNDGTAELTDTSVTSDISITVRGTQIEDYIQNIAGGIGHLDDGFVTTTGASVINTIFVEGVNVTSSEYGVQEVAGFYGFIDDDVVSFTSQSYVSSSISIEFVGGINDSGGFAGEVEGNQIFEEIYAIVDFDIFLYESEDPYFSLNDIGGFIGYGDAYSNVGFTATDVFVAGSIDITVSSLNDEGSEVADIGSFIGDLDRGVITNTYADVALTITVPTDGEVDRAGGYIGEISSSTVSHSFTVSPVSIQGENVSSTVAAMFGIIEDDGMVISTNLYFDVTRTGRTTCAVGDGNLTDTCTAVNTENAQSGYFINSETNSPLGEWDFDDVWQLDEDYYPVLAFAPYNGSETIVSAPRTSSGGSSFIAPSAPSVTDTTADFVVQSGAAATDSRLVTLTFTNVKNASSVAFSNTPDFSSVSYVPFDTESYSHTLTEGNGIKTVYAKLRSSQGGTLIVKDTINLTGQGFDQTVETTPTSAGASSCPLSVQTAYKTPQSNAIYYVTKDCTKRGFSSADLYFTYFSSWSDAQLTTQTLLNSVPNDTIGFLPLGPRYAPTSGALVKTLFDAKTYLLLQGTLYHIEDEAAAEFQFGPTWATWIEGVDERLLQNYPLSTTKLNTTDRLDGMLIKYPNDAKVYQLATESGEQVKRWIPTEEIFRTLNFRDDRIVTIPTSESYPDGTDLTN